jgi:hypothetical protein
MSTNDELRDGSARAPSERPDARIPEASATNAAEKAAAPAGAAAGALAGGTAGTLIAGPIGTAIGAIAGAIGGWWAGAGVEKHAELPSRDETYYRTHYEASAPPGGLWDQARPAYQLGHAAAANPAYRGRAFSDIESDLQHGWAAGDASSPGDWKTVRDLARCAYEHRANAARAEMEFADPGAPGDQSSHAASRVDFGPHSPDSARREFRSNP